MRLAEVLSRLKECGSARHVEGMQRYGIVAKKAYGVSAPELRALAKQIE